MFEFEQFCCNVIEMVSDITVITTNNISKIPFHECAVKKFRYNFQFFPNFNKKVVKIHA